MKKILIGLLFIGFIIGAFFVLKNFIKPTPPSCEPGFRFVPSSQTCEPIVFKDEKIDLAQFLIQIPGENTSVQLKVDDQEGHYSGVFRISSTSDIEGVVTLQEKDIVQYSEDLIVAPFLVNTGGTGQFLYLGVFDVNIKKHISSVFVGDRVQIDSLEIKNSRIHAQFKTRLASESFVVTPSIQSEIVLDITEGVLNEVVRLENALFEDIELKNLPIVTKDNMLTIRGAMPGTWYFEAIAQYRIFDNEFNETAFGAIQALSDWMTTQRVPFEISISTENLGFTGSGVLVIESANAQGGEEGERAMKRMYIPIQVN